jgi:hypothetical protein
MFSSKMKSGLIISGVTSGSFSCPSINALALRGFQGSVHMLRRQTDLSQKYHDNLTRNNIRLFNKVNLGCRGNHAMQLPHYFCTLFIKKM